MLDIRNGNYTYDAIFDIVSELQTKFEYAEKHSPLPKNIDQSKVDELVLEINKKVLRGSM